MLVMISSQLSNAADKLTLRRFGTLTRLTEISENLLHRSLKGDQRSPNSLPQTHKTSCSKYFFPNHVDTLQYLKSQKWRTSLRQATVWFSMATLAHSYKRLCGSSQQTLPLNDWSYGKQIPIWPTSRKPSPVSSSCTESELPIVQQEHCTADWR